MFAVATQGDATEQFGLVSGIERPFDANRKRLEIPRVVDFDRSARCDNPDDHGFDFHSTRICMHCISTAAYIQTACATLSRDPASTSRANMPGIVF
jgi:hypothetical protein